MTKGQRMSTERGKHMDGGTKVEPQGAGLRGLLEKWARVGDTAVQRDVNGVVVMRHPRCYLHSSGEVDGFCVVHGGFWHGYRVDPDRPADLALILTATIEAVEARRWQWMLSNGYDPKQHTAHVYAADAAAGSVLNVAGAACALLTAYLKCVDDLAAVEATT